MFFYGTKTPFTSVITLKLCHKKDIKTKMTKISLVYYSKASEWFNQKLSWFLYWKLLEKKNQHESIMYRRIMHLQK